MSTTSAFKISASHLKLFRLCPRSWYLKRVLHAPDDQGAGGLYLTRGNDFDRLVQLRVRDGVTGDSGAPKLANRQLAETLRHLPAPHTAEVQRAYSIPHPDGFVVTGKPDLRRPGFIQDTKTSSDRGPGRGAADDRQPYALTDEHTPGGNLRPLAEDEQALLYAWCELHLDPALAEVRCEWIYVSKADAPKAWVTRCVLGRAEVEEWFDSYVRPTVAWMRALAESGLPAEEVGASPDSCRRCFVRAACPGPFEGANVYGVSGPQKRENGMAFDLSKLKRAPAGAKPTPVAPDATFASAQAFADANVALAEAAPAVAINRPPSQRPAALTVGSIEGPGAAYLQLEFDDPKADPGPAPSIGGADTAEASTPSASPPTLSTTAGAPAPEGTSPKARRGRPRKSLPSDAVLDAGATSSPVSADPKAPTAAAGCVPSVGALAAAVSALIDAVRGLECDGKTGTRLADAVEALKGGVL